jgi:NADH dehydrogenase
MNQAARDNARRRLVTVFGGSGFLGRRIVRHLLDEGFEVQAASRRPERTASILESNAAGLMFSRADVQNDAEVVAALAGSYAVVNCVSLYVERGQNTFDSLHVEAAARLSRLAREAGVERLAHISGIGADPNSSSRYISARGRGEQVVQAAFPNAILIRPAVMFGSDDSFLTTLVKLVRILPVYPMFGRGETKMQPVYVEDVAEAATRLILNTDATNQPCHELGGPQIFTYEELLRTVARYIGARTRFMPMPFLLWHALASVSEHVSGAPLTRNQIALMQHDNVASPNLPGLPELGIKPTAIEAVLSEIERRSARGQRPARSV